MNTKDQAATLPATGKKVVIKRYFEAPRDVVWSAWTSPELLEKWFSASKEVKMDVLELDVRTGGHFRFVFSNLDGTRIPGDYTGKYVTVSAPTTLNFQVTDFSRNDDPAGITVLFEVELQSIGKHTQLTLTATLPEESYVELTTVAWNACFDNLDQTLKMR